MRTALLTLCAAAMSAPAADPVDTSFLKRYAETRGFMLGRPTKPKITPDGKTVLFLRSEATVPKQKLFAFDVATGKTTELLAPETLLKGGDENLTPEEKARRERQRVTVGGFADYHLDEMGTRVLVMLSGRPFVFDRTTKAVRELKAGQGTIVDPKWSPDGKFVSYVRDHDVYAYDLAADKELAVTTGGTAAKTHGEAEFVAQEEMGRHTGYWWSPDSKRIAYTEADHTGVEVWSTADPFKPDVRPPEQFYPRPGKKNVNVRLGVKPVSGGETAWVEWDRAKYEYLAVVKWDKPALTIQVQDRGQHELLLLKVDPSTGRTTRLVSERSQQFVNIHQELPVWTADGKQFLWATEGSGRPQLVLLTPEGAEPYVIWPGEELTRDNFRELLSVDQKRRIVYYLANREPTGTQLVRASLDRDRPRAKDPNLGIGMILFGSREHLPTASFTADHSVYVVTYTGREEMPTSLVCRATEDDGVKVGQLPSVAEEPSIQPIPPKSLWLSEVGGYWTAVVRPRNFDPKKKYPVIVDVYGGPRHLHVTWTWRNWLVPQWLADQGFVVVAVDNRGTPGRGRDWERAVYQKFGTVPLEDQAKGLAALCDKFPELDRDRVGIVGWSFGGYMAANAVLRRPDVFKAAVAGASVTDWEDYDTHYTERYLGLLPESKAAYDEASLIPLAKNLSRPLLLVHGTADDNVYFRHTLKLSDALLRAGKEFEVLPLPGVTHMYTADPQVTERLWARSVAFFKRHLGEPR